MSADPGVFGVIDILTGYQQAAILVSAARVGVFDVLAEEALPARTVAERLGTDPVTTLALLDSLTGLGLLRRDDIGYTPVDSARRLATGGDLRLIAEKEAFFEGVWQSLEATVRSGERQIPSWRDRLMSDPEQSLAFLRALTVLARETGPDLTRLPGVRPGARIADFGGGLGSYAVQLAGADADVALIDLPPVIGWAHTELTALAPEIRGRITLVALDLLSSDAADELGGGYDLVLLSHLLHEVDDAQATALLSLATAILRPGGTVAVFELPGDPQSGALAAFGPMFDLMMRIETGSRARRFADVEQLLRAAGLSDVRRADYALPHGVLLGTRPTLGE